MYVCGVSVCPYLRSLDRVIASHMIAGQDRHRQSSRKRRYMPNAKPHNVLESKEDGFGQSENQSSF